MIRISKEKFIQKCNKIHKSKYDYSLSEYVNNKTKLKIICPIHGEFLMRPDSHLKTSGCKKCSQFSRRYTKNEFIIEANNIHNNKYDYSLVEYKTNKISVKIICIKHGEFLMRPDSHLNGQGCKWCGVEKRSVECMKSTKSFIDECVIIHGKKFDYSTVVYLGPNEKIKIKCNKCNYIFEQTSGNHLYNEQGCPKCSNNLKMTNELFKEKAEKIHKNNLYDYSLVNYINTSTPVFIKCNKCNNIFKQKPNDHLGGHGCSKCFHIISKNESKFLDYLNIENRQEYVKPYRVDGIKDNVIYEFLGDYWHGNPEKYNPNDINKRSKKTFGELYSRTVDKFFKLKNGGYSIKYIWESDWNNFKKGNSIFPNIKEFI